AGPGLAIWHGCSSSAGPGTKGDRMRRLKSNLRAGVAHLAERDLPKVEVAGSSPVSRSNSLHVRIKPATFPDLNLFALRRTQSTQWKGRARRGPDWRTSTDGP